MTLSYHEPGKLEVWLTVLAGKLFGRSVYEPYVDSLGLRGDEKVLDFGSGAGTPAQLIARKLAEGSGTLTCVDVSQVWIETAQKRLKAYSNVTFLSGEISDLDIPDKSQDVVLIHFVVHDIPAGERPGVVKHLARKLADGGKLFIREPLDAIAHDEIRRLMGQSGLREIDSTRSQVPLMGPTYEGIYIKGEQEHA